MATRSQTRISIRPRLDLPELRAFDPDVEMTGWVVVSERHFRPALARIENGENPTILLRSDACDPQSMRPIEVDRRKLAWFATEKPVGFIGRLMRVYYRGGPAP